MNKAEQLDASKLVGYKTENKYSSIDSTSAILFSLGIGFSVDAMDENDLRYTIFLCMATQLTKVNTLKTLQECEHVPASFNPFKLLHVEQRVEFYAPVIKMDTEYTTKTEICEAIDKEKLSLFTFKCETFDKQSLAFINYFKVLVRDLGGAGFSKTDSNIPKIPKPPQRQPDQILMAPTFANQAILFRLSGDMNPLHIDPKAASFLKFPRPILHGLCSLGVIIRAIMRQCLQNDQGRIKNYHTKFVGHVFPGQKLEIRIWKHDKNTLIFQASVVQRSKKVLEGSVQVNEQPSL